MKMPSVKFYNHRARVFGGLLALSLVGYLLIRSLISILA
ncbi:hypothetical protein BH09BAC3_BH09BAC3_21610 [soil metagenome]